MAGIDLRGYSFLDSLQPQYAAFLGTVAQGFLPLAGDSSLYVEISPGIEINRMTDVALKATKVKPGMQIVERFFGLLEVHFVAGRDACRRRRHPGRDRGEGGRSHQAADRFQPDHSPHRRPPGATINRMRHGQMIIPGQTMYLLEMEPASYAALAANEAEKAANINVLEVRSFGSLGRVYLGGEESDIDVGWRAAVAALEGLTGRDISS